MQTNNDYYGGRSAEANRAHRAACAALSSSGQSGQSSNCKFCRVSKLFRGCLNDWLDLPYGQPLDIRIPWQEPPPEPDPNPL